VKLGLFLKTLNREERGIVTVATKFGEHWDVERGMAFVDHSYDALCRSLERSLLRLGRIDLLQLHRTNPGVLRSAELAKAWEFALKAGVKKIGVSASDPASAAATLELGYGVMQMPYNVTREDMGPAFRDAAARGIELLINRPYQAGARLYDAEPADRARLFAHVLKVPFRGWVLTGTRSAEHLKENLGAFRQALEGVDQDERTTN
jgi:aryl-alcohol dehydrogenase-like predicted oxidoreductase